MRVGIPGKAFFQLWSWLLVGCDLQHYISCLLFPQPTGSLYHCHKGMHYYAYTYRYLSCRPRSSLGIQHYTPIQPVISPICPSLSVLQRWVEQKSYQAHSDINIMRASTQFICMCYSRRTVLTAVRCASLFDWPRLEVLAFFEGDDGLESGS